MNRKNILSYEGALYIKCLFRVSMPKWFHGLKNRLLQSCTLFRNCPARSKGVGKTWAQVGCQKEKRQYST